MNKLVAFFMLMFFVSVPSVRGQGEFVFRYPTQRDYADTLKFQAQLTDSLRVHFGLTDDQASAYRKALMSASSPADTTVEYSQDGEIAGVLQRMADFEREVEAVLGGERFAIWKQKWEPYSPKTTAFMLFPYYSNTKRLITREHESWFDWDIRQEKTYVAQDDYAALLAKILDVDSTAAAGLFVEVLLLNDYLPLAEVRLWGIPHQQAFALGMLLYEHEHRLRAIKHRNVSGFMKDILRQREDEVYWNSIIDTFGYDFYCDWFDYVDLGSRKLGDYDIPDEKMDEFRKIQKQLEIDRVKIHRGMPGISDEEKQRLVKEAEARRDAAVEKLHNRR
jgi:hypothetical protein